MGSKTVIGGSVFLLVSAVVLASLLLYSPEAPAAPKVSWEPSSVTHEVDAGGSVSVTVSYTAAKDMRDVVVRVVPELAPYVTVTPLSFGDVSKGETHDLNLTLSAPVDAESGTVDGTIQLRSGSGPQKTYAKPLPVTVDVVWPTTTTPTGVMFSYPGTFALNEKLNTLTDTISVTNFHGAYESGGLIPAGGADIVVAELPPLTEELDTFLTSKLSVATTIDSRESITVDGSSAARVSYTVSFTPTFSMRYVEVYVPLPLAMYKFSLLYNNGDPGESEFLTTFQKLLSTVQLPR